MGTKGRTGNKKAIAAANSKKKASYDSKLKSYNDSTASYQNEIKNFNILTKKKGKHSSGRFTDAEHKKNMDDVQKNLWGNVKRGIYIEDGLMNHNKGTKIHSYLMAGKNAANHSYEVDPSYTKESIDKKLKPTKPKPPVYEKYVPRKIDKINKITPLELKKLPVRKIEEIKLKKTSGYLANKGKYKKNKKNKLKDFIVSLNPFSGNKVVRKKRNVRNLVTGKNNRIQ